MKINGVEFIQHHKYHPHRRTIQGGMKMIAYDKPKKQWIANKFDDTGVVIDTVPLISTADDEIAQIVYQNKKKGQFMDYDDAFMIFHRDDIKDNTNVKSKEEVTKYLAYNKDIYDPNDYATIIRNLTITGRQKSKQASSQPQTQAVQVYKPPTSFKLPSSVEVQNSLRSSTGGDYGKKFEDYIEKQKELLFYLNGKQSIILNNDRNTKLSQVKNIKIGGKLLSEADLYLIDFSLDNSDIELKYWNTNQYKISFDKRETIQMHYNTQTRSYDKPDTITSIPDGVPLQDSKIIGTDWFAPLFINIGTSTNPKYKLYNVYDKKKNKFINDNYNKDYYILMCVKEGFYKYKVNDDLDFEYKKVPIKGDNGEELFRLKNNKYKEGNGNIAIPFNKWEKINL